MCMAGGSPRGDSQPPKPETDGEEMETLGGRRDAVVTGGAPKGDS